MSKDLLDKKIIYYSIIKHNSSGYDESDKYEEILDLLQDLRVDQKGSKLNTYEIEHKIDNLETEAQLKRGDLIRVGNMLIPSIERIKQWKGICEIPRMFHA